MRAFPGGDFVQRTGDTMTGQLTINDAIGTPLTLHRVGRATGDVIAIRTDSANRSFLAIGGTGEDIEIKDSGAAVRVAYDLTADSLAIGRVPLARMLIDGAADAIAMGGQTFKLQQAGVTRYEIDTAGKQLVGTVPLARMGTVVLDASQAIGANTDGGQNIGLDADVHRFLVYSAYVAGNVLEIANGSYVNAAEAVVAAGHTFIRRTGLGGSYSIALVNGTAVARTYTYKVYSLTET